MAQPVEVERVLAWPQPPATRLVPPGYVAGVDVEGVEDARSEGYNRLANHVERDAFGFRNPINQRRGYGGHALANIGG